MKIKQLFSILNKFVKAYMYIYSTPYYSYLSINTFHIRREKKKKMLAHIV